MTSPSGVHSLTDLEIVFGEPLFRSYILLGGVLPINYSDLTLVSLDEGRGFLERSPMLSMKQWEHDRRIVAHESGCVLVDRLQFEPRFASRLVGWFIGRVFNNRHRVLRDAFGEVIDGMA